MPIFLNRYTYIIDIRSLLCYITMSRLYYYFVANYERIFLHTLLTKSHVFYAALTTTYTNSQEILLLPFA